MHFTRQCVDVNQERWTRSASHIICRFGIYVPKIIKFGEEMTKF